MNLLKSHKKWAQISLILILITNWGFISCTKDDDALYTVDQGVYVLNRGVSGEGWDITFYQFLNSKVVEDYFYAQNPGISTAGNSATRMVEHNKNVYVLSHLASEGTIWEFDLTTLKKTDEITGFKQPVDMVFLTDTVAVVADQDRLCFTNISLGTLESELALNGSPGRMLLKGKYMYVTNSQSNQVWVVNHESRQIVYAIETIGIPSDLSIDGQNQVWIYGLDENRELAGLTRFKHLTWEIEQPDQEQFPLHSNGMVGNQHLESSPTGTFVYYMQNGLKRHYIYNEGLPVKGFLGEKYADTQFSGVDVDVRTGALYCLHPQATGSTDQVVIFSSNGKFFKAFEAGYGSVNTVIHF